MLKDRSGQGYERLGKQAGASGSSLHRYCSGKSVPADYRVVHSFAKVCGASPAELRELHQLWALADAGRVDEPEQAGAAPGDDAAPPRRRLAYAATAVAVVVLLAGGLVWFTAGSSAPATGRYADRMLFSEGCRPPVSMGQHDECVTEVQNLLVAAHGRLSVDGSFGPETLRRVTAFQVLAGLPARGVVDEATKTALYDHRASMATW